MNCARCDHPAERHCAGQVTHVDAYKGNREVVTVCVGRHCLNPLCSCVEFVKPEVRQ